MSVLLLTHPACLDHETGSWHPESPARLRAVLKALEAPEFSGLVREDAPAATEETLSLAHDPAYIRAVLAAIPAQGAEAVHLDADTVVSPGSGEAALRAAGAVVAAVDAVMTGRFDRAFCAIRPPGHHAEPGRPMGFCLFNNVAVGALHARAAYKVNRIAVVDFDVHHGNGTQAMFQNDPDLFYGSIHQAPFYPGTGKMSERGVAGNILNIPFGAGSGASWCGAPSSNG
ncbi:histone deacetylase family protein [Tistrella bauzanensis]